MKRLGLSLVVALVWLLRWIPLAWLDRAGSVLGYLVYRLAAGRRHVALVNLALCFPDWSPAHREQVARAHFRVFVRSILSIGVQWYAPRARLETVARIVGREHWDGVRDRPVILFAPHFLALDLAGVRLSAERPMMALYGRNKDLAVDHILQRHRLRFPDGLLFSRQDGLRPVVRALRTPYSLYYLPDQDFGPRESIFVPFFGVPAATTPSMARLARITGALVVPCVARQLEGGAGVEITIYPPWDDYPSGDDRADARRMNAFIEERVREMPEQYLWTHKRFKTRPPGAS
jgi:Kdo2-lipid IVA lauroyltransferase/acyltransferase